METLAKPYNIKGYIVHSTASIGITTSAINYSTPEDMLRDADIAMYRAKAAGKACCMLFDREMHQQAMARLTLENDLRAAIANQQFVLHYQPIVSVARGTTIGFEALVRWKHPVRGMVPPSDFIPLAEEIGIIVPLGDWVLAEASRQLAEWRTRRPEFADISLSVNLSRKQLAAPDLVASIDRYIKSNGLRPSDLKLEITESAIMDNPEEAIRVLHEIRQINVELHMDDFGTGYSSLSCLHRFPIGGLKIDRSFVSRMVERKDFAIVIDTIISLTQKLNLRLVAEGVETEEQLLLLRSMGCQLAQGYYFAKPLAAGDAERFAISEYKLRQPEVPRVSAA
jgi:EAL domain-containing protein (putative c-di-GMP-specific phosphodiesterase class I)